MTESNNAINPASEEFRTNCVRHYLRLLREQPVCRTETDQWLVCGYADVKRILTDYEHFQRPVDWSSQRKPPGPLRCFGENNMVAMNPPRHTRFRQSAARGFARRKVQEMAPKIETLVDKLLDAMAEKEAGDFIEDFAFPLPVYVICEMMGISHEEHDLFGECTADMLASLEMSATPEVFDRGARAAEILFNYCKDAAATREGSVGEDLISSLIAKESEDKMSRDEVIWTAVTMLIAGHETTTHMLGNGMLTMIENPDQCQALRADNRLAANATEEILRVDPTLYVLFRETIDDVELSGQRIPAGSFLLASVFAANHDPQVFDRPEQFDIRRSNADEHLSFASGRHLCLGHAVARLEGQIAFSAIFNRLTAIQTSAEPVPRNGLMFRGNFSIPLSWQARH